MSILCFSSSICSCKVKFVIKTTGRVRLFRPLRSHQFMFSNLLLLPFGRLCVRTSILVDSAFAISSFLACSWLSLLTQQPSGFQSSCFLGKSNAFLILCIRFCYLFATHFDEGLISRASALTGVANAMTAMPATSAKWNFGLDMIFIKTTSFGVAFVSFQRLVSLFGYQSVLRWSGIEFPAKSLKSVPSLVLPIPIPP